MGDYQSLSKKLNPQEFERKIITSNVLSVSSLLLISYVSIMGYYQIITLKIPRHPDPNSKSIMKMKIIIEYFIIYFALDSGVSARMKRNIDIVHTVRTITGGFLWGMEKLLGL
jgi:hypothetical protein